jgi:hypothetical protein
LPQNMGIRIVNIHFLFISCQGYGLNRVIVKLIEVYLIGVKERNHDDGNNPLYLIFLHHNTTTCSDLNPVVVKSVHMIT